VGRDVAEPITETERVWVGGGMASNVAVTVLSASIVSAQGSVPAQSPPLPGEGEPGVGSGSEGHRGAEAGSS